MGGGGCCVGNLPCINCGLVRKIVDKVKDVLGISSSGSKHGGQTESYQADTATLQATIKVQKALTEFSSDTQNRSSELEIEIVKESREYLDAFLDDLRKYNKIRYGNRRLNINLSHIERENRKTEDKIHGFIVNRVKRRVSMDNDECADILAMDPGKQKEDKVDEFYKKVLKEAVLELSDELRTNMETQTDNVCDRIQHRIDSIVDVCEAKAEEFDRVRELKECGEAEIEGEQIRLSHFVAMCEFGLSQLD